MILDPLELKPHRLLLLKQPAPLKPELLALEGQGELSRALLPAGGRTAELELKLLDPLPGLDGADMAPAERGCLKMRSEDSREEGPVRTL